MDSIVKMLREMNRSELVQVARAAGLGNVTRDQSRTRLVDLIVTDDGATPDALDRKREAMEAHIHSNMRWLRSQITCPDGNCRTFGCPDLVVARCWRGFHRDIL